MSQRLFSSTVITLLLAGCSLVPAATPTLQPTTTPTTLIVRAPAGVPASRLNPTVNLSAPLVGLQPGSFPTPTIIGASTAVASAPACTDQASFVKDVTVPDGQGFAPNASFTKTWRLFNSGTCKWGTDYSLVFSGGHLLGAPQNVPLTQVVKGGEQGDLSINMVAPTIPGKYQGGWKLRSARGALIGVGPNSQLVFWVKMVVKYNALSCKSRRRALGLRLTLTRSKQE